MFHKRTLETQPSSQEMTALGTLESARSQTKSPPFSQSREDGGVLRKRSQMLAGGKGQILQSKAGLALAEKVHVVMIFCLCFNK